MAKVVVAARSVRVSVCSLGIALGIALGAGAVRLEAETSWREEWLSQVNFERGRSDRPPLRLSPALAQAAQEQAEEMVASGRRLRSPSSGQVSSLLRRIGYSAYDWRESYLTSPEGPDGKRQTAQLGADSRYREVGVGTAYGDGFTLRVFLFALSEEDVFAAAASSLADRNRVASAMLERLNALRRRYGLSGVALSPLLDRAAQAHADDMLDRSYFGHASLEGDSPSDRARREGYPSGAGENIVEGPFTADAALRAWLESPPHRRNLLDPGCREIGLGFALGTRNSERSRYRAVWVMSFGAGSPAAPQLSRDASEQASDVEIEVERVVVVGGKG